MIDWINRNEARHILTIEDPVEFVHESRRSLIRHREVGLHTLRFHNALRAALREDPDVILVGEIRDQETLSTALEAAQTGHLVFGTLHTNSAVKTVERVLGMYPPEEQAGECAPFVVRVAAGSDRPGIDQDNRCKTDGVSRHPDQHRRLQGLHPAGGAR